MSPAHLHQYVASISPGHLSESLPSSQVIIIYTIIILFKLQNNKHFGVKKSKQTNGKKKYSLQLFMNLFNLIFCFLTKHSPILQLTWFSFRYFSYFFFLFAFDLSLFSQLTFWVSKDVVHQPTKGCHDSKCWLGFYLSASRCLSLSLSLFVFLSLSSFSLSLSLSHLACSVSRKEKWDFVVGCIKSMKQTQ